MIVKKKESGLSRARQKLAIAGIADVTLGRENTLTSGVLVRGEIIGETGTISVTARIVVTVTETVIVTRAGNEETGAVANHLTDTDETVAAANHLTDTDETVAAANLLTDTDETVAAANLLTDTDETVATANHLTVIDETVDDRSN